MSYCPSSLTFSTAHADKRVQAAATTLGEVVVQRLLAFALFLMGARREDIAQHLSIPLGTLFSLLTRVGQHGLPALEDRRHRHSQFRPPPHPSTVPLKVAAKKSGIVLDFGPSGATVSIPGHHPLQTKVFLLTLLHSGVLDRSRVARWLESPSVVREGGRVMAWHNPGHPGYAYPEAAGFWLSWAVWRSVTGLVPPSSDRLHAVARWLLRELADNGAVGRGDCLYLFDTCVVVDALVHGAHRGLLRLDGGDALALALPTLARFVDADKPVFSPRAVSSRWSTSWTPHLIRAAALLTRASRFARNEQGLALARRLRGNALDRGTADGRVLTHAHAYAIEGELLLGALGSDTDDRSAMEGADTLAAIQSPDGGLPAWRDGSGPFRTDATAQAARIWACLGASRYAKPLKAALHFLGRAQAPRGGLVYECGGAGGCESDGADVNTWASIFADQAAHWGSGQPKPRTWV